MNVLVPELGMFRTLAAPPVPTAGPAMTLVVVKTQATDCLLYTSDAADE